MTAGVISVFPSAHGLRQGEFCEEMQVNEPEDGIRSKTSDGQGVQTVFIDWGWESNVPLQLGDEASRERERGGGGQRERDREREIDR